MKILIIGKDSYIGTHIRRVLLSRGHEVEELDVISEEVSADRFSNVDSVIHVAAIVHRKDIEDYETYKTVNVELPLKVATVSKDMGVKQFVFFSSMAVYGKKKSFDDFWIDENTPLNPRSFYGKSKLEAENRLFQLEGDGFGVCAIRPANVYGKDCRGEYIKKFKKITSSLPVIPNAFEDTKQGMIYIDNLCELVRLIVENNARGVYAAQDKHAVSTVELMQEIARAIGIKRKKSKFIGFLVKLLRFGAVKKLYGGIAYREEYASTELGNYNIIDFAEAITNTYKQTEDEKNV